MANIRQNHLAEARVLIAASRYEEAMRIYTELCTREPMNSPVFKEMLDVGAHLISIKSAVQSMKLKRDLNAVVGKRQLEHLLKDKRYDDPRRLERSGCKVYSQHDEDGIIAEIFRRIGTQNRTFFEFGVENGIECNTHFLLHSGWKGVWAEGNRDYVGSARNLFGPAISTGHLKVLERLITKDNINQTIDEVALPKDLDLMSIDIDFNDYWVFKVLEAVEPRVMVVEYNGKFPPPMRRVVPYNPERAWGGTDYYGCSLQSLADLAESKGYNLVGCNITGVNAFFVRNELCQDLFAMPATAQHLYQPPRYELFQIGAFEVGHPGSFGYWLDI